MAETLNSKTTKILRASITNDILSSKPKIKLLYVTPELCETSNFQVLYILKFNIYKFKFQTIDIFSLY